ncbi:DNA polymerase III subunit gamma/tau [Euzebya rosea]|uniref:DNA polymerase III subunit gamma/tau n=1 Tax=Euzebya rosea TaxID=2052804 RepID=UPI0013009B2E|nr:DNA polymerase III subunit gamma/tau [Euzebya rosea]
MAHVSLYRKYRPATFAEVVGQDHVTTTLARAVDSGSWHHAYLFTGPRGTGKTSSARIFAMALNATEGPTSSPDQDDPIVRSIRNGTAPDVIEIDAASNNKVEDVRDLVDRVAFTPAIARQKVYIVDECHMLTTQAWNAFLKTIEEPPGHVVFVFATTEPHKVLPTVLSRTQRFDFRRVPAKVLADHCRRLGDLEGFTFADDALAAIVRAGDGSVRDTLSVLDQVVAFTGKDITAEGVADVLGSVPATLLDALAGHLADSDVAGVLRVVDRVADGGTDLRQFATDAVEHLRSLVLLRAAPDAGLIEATPDRVAELKAQADRTGVADLLRAVELLNDAQPRMRRGNTRLPLEIALAKAALPEAGSDVQSLAARLERLEASVANGAGPAATPAMAVPPAASAPAAAPATPVAQPAPVPAEPDAPTAPARAEHTAEPAEPSPAQPEPAAPTRPPERAAEPTTDAAAAADPQPQAAAADRARAGGAEDLQAIVNAWPAIMDMLGGTSRRLAAIFGEGTPIAIAEGALILRFAFDFHAQQAGDGDSARTVADIVERVVGTRYRIRATVGAVEEDPPSPHVKVDDEASAVINHEAAEAAGEVTDEAAAHDAAIRTLTAVLGAEVTSDTQG